MSTAISRYADMDMLEEIYSQPHSRRSRHAWEWSKSLPPDGSLKVYQANLKAIKNPPKPKVVRYCRGCTIELSKFLQENGVMVCSSRCQQRIKDYA